jgi:glycosyltransferase involved in cell wall biosynthesis
MTEASLRRRILQIGNWPPPVCGWTMNLVGLRKELQNRGWDCPVMNLNENRRVKNSDYIDVQSGWDYVKKVTRHVWNGYAVHVRANGETQKGYWLALAALALARVFRQASLLTYCGGHQQTYFPAPQSRLRHGLFALLFRVPHVIFCNSEGVKAALLTTGIRPEKVVPIAHFSAHYIQFTPTRLPADLETFYQRHEGVFFLYACFRPEYDLEFVAEAIRRFRRSHPSVGFAIVGAGERELGSMKRFVEAQKLDHAVCLLGSVPHDLFLTLLGRSLAYVRVPVTDGVCSSVLEALALKVPVLAADNGARPPGTELWRKGDIESLLLLLRQAATQRDAMVARIQQPALEDNVGRLADSIEEICLSVQEGRRDLFSASARPRSAEQADRAA